MNISLLKFSFFTAVIISTIGCASNLLPQNLEGGISAESREKAYAILQESRKAQGQKNLEDKAAYRITGVDTWKGILGTIGKPWHQNRTHLQFTFSIQDFDGQVEYLDGDMKGYTAAYMGKEFYLKNEDGQYEKQEKINKAVVFGIEALKFLGEALEGVLSAEYIGYEGEEEYRGRNCDVIYATWKSIEPNDEFDQYRIYINQETKLVERLEYTIRKNYMWMPGDAILYGNAVYDDYRDVGGYKIPFVQTVFAFSVNDDIDNNLHQLVIEDVEYLDQDVKTIIEENLPGK